MKELNYNIFRPTRSNFLTQPFGVNMAFVKVDSRGYPIRPFKVKGAIDGKCPEGYIPFYKAIGMKGHNGLDFALWYGEPVYHCGDFDGFFTRSNVTDLTRSTEKQ